MIAAMIAALVLQAAPAQGAAVATPAVAAKPAVAKTEPEKKVCRYQVVVGSSIEQRVCKTKAQWEAEAAAAAASLDKINIDRAATAGTNQANNF